VEGAIVEVVVVVVVDVVVVSHKERLAIDR
jgi:hypothetical protein